MDAKTLPLYQPAVECCEDQRPIELLGRKVYIAGPMTGYPDLNRASFFAAEEYLKGQGALIMNPAILPDGWEHHDYMSIAIPMMMTCNTVAFLPGWRESKGANMEFTRSQAFALVQVSLDMGKLVEGKPWVRGHKALLA